jgi:hypothetical protein
MEHAGEYNKAWVALAMAVLTIVELFTGWSISDKVSEEVIVGILAILTPILVWAVPNSNRS